MKFTHSFNFTHYLQFGKLYSFGFQCDAIQEKVGYPEWIMDNDELDEYYKEVK